MTPFYVGEYRDGRRCFSDDADQLMAMSGLGSERIRCCDDEARAAGLRASYAKRGRIDDLQTLAERRRISALRARLLAEVERSIRRAAWAAIAADPARTAEEREIAAAEARS